MTQSSFIEVDKSSLKQGFLIKIGTSSEPEYDQGVSDKKKKRELPGLKKPQQPELTDTMLEMKAIPFFIDSSGHGKGSASPEPETDIAEEADFEDQDDTVRMDAEEEDLTATDFDDDSEG